MLVAVWAGRASCLTQTTEKGPHLPFPESGMELKPAYLFRGMAQPINYGRVDPLGERNLAACVLGRRRLSGKKLRPPVERAATRRCIDQFKQIRESKNE